MIEVKNLVKKYASNTAVNNISFTVEDGKVYGFLGPNGAGKSTTMNIITGCLAATSGTVTIGGYDIFEEPVKAKRKIGYLPEIPPLYPDMTVTEYLTFVARTKGIKKAAIKEELDFVMQKTDITGVSRKLIKFLSKGFKQRVGIAQAILGNPDLIILDEPTVGLDPKQIVEIRSLIRELAQKHTVILSSHILAEVSEVCDEIIIINAGKIVASDTADNLIKKFNPETVIEVTIKADIDFAVNTLKVIPEIKSIDADEAGEDGCVRILIHTDSKEDIREKISTALMKAGVIVLSMNVVKASLEDIFLEVTGENIGMLLNGGSPDSSDYESLSYINGDVCDEIEEYEPDDGETEYIEDEDDDYEAEDDGEDDTDDFSDEREEAEEE
ncbi:MAG: ABC transporter ATP-binding protein [Clostridiales bacterium]|nr:ABC transporter ATP-binding protein [Clostridiales bacterium]